MIQHGGSHGNLSFDEFKNRCRRIAVIGCPGSGKTQFSQKLARLLSLPYFSLDDQYWLRNWVRTPRSEWQFIHSRLLSEPAWVIDGNYANEFDVRLAAADCVIFLDLSMIVCLWAILARECARFAGRQETLPLQIRCDSSYRHRRLIDFALISKVARFRSQSRPEILTQLRNAENCVVVLLTSRRSALRFLLGVEQFILSY